MGLTCIRCLLMLIIRTDIISVLNARGLDIPAELDPLFQQNALV